MKLIETAWRLTRLGLYVGAGAVLALAGACGGRAAPRDAASERPDADVDADRESDATPPADAEAAEDADERWDVPLE